MASITASCARGLVSSTSGAQASLGRRDAGFRPASVQLQAGVACFVEHSLCSLRQPSNMTGLAVSVGNPTPRGVVSRATDDDLEAKMAKDLQSLEEFMPDFDELDKDELQQFLALELESSLDYETFRHYEIMYLIHEKNAAEVQDVIKKVSDFITESKGKIYRLNDWGLRTLAYDIKKAKKANYVLMNIEITSQVVNQLNTLLEKDERVIRHMVMSQKTAITADSVPPEEYRTLRDVEDYDEDEEYEWDDEEGDEEEDEEEEETELVLQKE